MKTGRSGAQWMRTLWRRWSRPPELSPPPAPLKIGLALGGGFARGIAHAGVLRVFEQHHIPIDVIGGVSAGAIVAAAFASGATAGEIAKVGASMRFGDVARWTIGRMGFVVSERMERFLKRLLKFYRFEDMRIPLGVVATDLATGEPVFFHGQGDVALPIRASCSYPGLFQPVQYDHKLLVDGAMSMEIPALLVRQLGATRVISVHLPMQGAATAPNNVFQVVNRCFQILQRRTEESWRSQSDLVIEPDVRGMQWDDFSSAMHLVEAGELAARAVLPRIEAWLQPRETSRGVAMYHQEDWTLTKS